MVIAYRVHHQEHLLGAYVVAGTRRDDEEQIGHGAQRAE